LQGRYFSRNFFNAVKGHDAHFGIFKGYSVAGVVIVHDAIQADDFTGHLKARDLVAAVFGGKAGFEKSGANGVEGRELFAIAEQGAATLNFAAGGHQIVKAI
jgi:hypothetical protein